MTDFDKLMNNAFTTDTYFEDVDDSENIPYDPNIFWKKLQENWLLLYKGFFTNNIKNTLFAINSFLPDDDLEIEATIGMINSLQLSPYEKFVELYISPKLKNTSIGKMKKLYNARIDLPWLRVSCYKAYHPKDVLINDIDYGKFIIKYDDLCYNASFGYNGKKPIINIIIIVKKEVAEYFLVKKKVDFHDELATSNDETENNSDDEFKKDTNSQKQESYKGTREVWVQNNYFPVDIILLNVLGEYNLINHVGYIELLHENDELVKPGCKFFELADLKKELEFLYKHYKYEICNYCQHNSLQTKLLTCNHCKTVFYCGKICQKADWNNHKLICKNN